MLVVSQRVSRAAPRRRVARRRGPRAHSPQARRHGDAHRRHDPRHHGAQADRARDAAQPRAARATERYRPGADLLRRHGPLLRTCNAEYSKWFGLPREEIVGRSMEEVLGAAAWRIVGPHVEQSVLRRAVGVRGRGRLSSWRQALDPCALYAASRSIAATSSASCASSRTSRRAGRPRTRARGSLPSSTRPTTRSSARASTASSRAGTPAPRACSATAPRRPSASPS